MFETALSLLAGGGLVGAGFLLGRLPPRRRIPKPPRPVVPRCGCGDHYALHEQLENGSRGRCLAEREFDPDAEEPIMNESGNVILGWKDVPIQLRPCPCPGYYGPEPLPEYIPREISG